MNVVINLSTNIVESMFFLATKKTTSEKYLKVKEKNDKLYGKKLEILNVLENEFRIRVEKQLSNGQIISDIINDKENFKLFEKLLSIYVSDKEFLDYLKNKPNNFASFKSEDFFIIDAFDDLNLVLNSFSKLSKLSLEENLVEGLKNFTELLTSINCLLVAIHTHYLFYFTSKYKELKNDFEASINYHSSSILAYAKYFGLIDDEGNQEIRDQYSLIDKTVINEQKTLAEEGFDVWAKEIFEN